MIEAVAWRVVLGDYVAACAVSPDGGLVAAGSLAGDAVLARTLDGEVIAKLTTHPLGVLAAGWSHRSVLAVGGQDGAVHLYEPSGRHLACVDVGGWVASLAWSPDGTLLAVGAGRSVTLLRADGATNVRYDAVASTITAVAWSPNGRRVGAAAYGGITWYDPTTAPATAPTRTFSWKGSLLSLALSPTGRWACGGAQDASIHLWPLWSGDELAMSGYPAKIEQLAFRPDGRWLASACLGELTVWDFGGKGPGGRRPAAGSAHDRHITAVAWQPGAGERAMLSTAAADGRIALWSSPRRQGETIRPLDVVQHPVGSSALAWTSPRTLVVGRADGTLEHRVVAPRV